MTITFRDTLRKISPRWLQGYFGERVLYSIGVQCDALGDAAAEAVKLRMPGKCPDEALVLIGKDRRIVQGIDEPNSVYASRLTRWLDDHATRGGPYGLFGQLRARYAQDPFVIDVVYVTGRRFRLNVDGTIEIFDDDWAPPDDNLAQWGRWWLFYRWPTAIPGMKKWGEPTLGDGTAFGTGLSAADLASIRLIPREWNAAHAYAKDCWIILSSGTGIVWGAAPTEYLGTGRVFGGGATATMPLQGSI